MRAMSCSSLVCQPYHSCICTRAQVAALVLLETVNSVFAMYYSYDRLVNNFGARRVFVSCLTRPWSHVRELRRKHGGPGGLELESASSRHLLFGNRADLIARFAAFGIGACVARLRR